MIFLVTFVFSNRFWNSSYQFLIKSIIKLLLHTLSTSCLVSSSVEESVLLGYTLKLQKSTLHFKTSSQDWTILWTKLKLFTGGLEVNRDCSGGSSGDWTHLQLQLQLQLQRLQQFTLQNRKSGGHRLEAGSKSSSGGHRDCSGDILTPSLCQVWRSIETAVKCWWR